MLSITVNGTRHQVDVPQETPLLWAIRDELDMTGTKFGCGLALCGCCSVHIDGEAVRSCVLPVTQAVGKQIHTIESLSTDNSHPMQKAWIAEQVPQCGYCQSGQIWLQPRFLKNPHPTDDNISASMTNICRCGTYDSHPERDSSRGRGRMSASTSLVERGEFIRLATTLGVGLTLAVALPKRGAAAASSLGSDFAANAWVRIGADDVVTIVVSKSEMGQGVATGLPTILADQLDASMNRVRIEFAPPEGRYNDAVFGSMVTDGSTSVVDSWMPLRTAGATARAILVEAAAKRWGVPISTCTAPNSVVYHEASNLRATYGNLAHEATKSRAAERRPEITGAIHIDRQKPSTARHPA